ncbi:hypothetical protein CVT26_001738 [Gymnopilus dilepis]|uniref:Uncharacterized protein n=1 Tax=Gymnopilus dilepis TaxID=231916 RepID=A0A409VRA9_9AGAR|nr:hypothetical protein CVT26_001738 [Gymnopilus dilepis]
MLPFWLRNQELFPSYYSIRTRNAHWVWFRPLEAPLSLSIGPHSRNSNLRLPSSYRFFSSSLIIIDTWEVFPEFPVLIAYPLFTPAELFSACEPCVRRPALSNSSPAKACPNHLYTCHLSLYVPVMTEALYCLPFWQIEFLQRAQSPSDLSYQQSGSSGVVPISFLRDVWIAITLFFELHRRIFTAKTMKPVDPASCMDELCFFYAFQCPLKIAVAIHLWRLAKYDPLGWHNRMPLFKAISR